MLSGNTIGATYYSDGKCDAPMLHSSVVIIKCAGCKQFVWVRDMKSAEVPPLETEESTSDKMLSLDNEKEEVEWFKKELARKEKERNHRWKSIAEQGMPTKSLTLQEFAEALVANIAKNKEDERYLRLIYLATFQ